MKISGKGLELIKHFEGLRLEAYIPVPGDVPTIGYGATLGVKIGDIINEKTAEDYLIHDVSKFEKCVTHCIQKPLRQNEFDACVCLAYNIGCTAFIRSTLLMFINFGDSSAAANQFLVWNKFKGKPLAGLTRRRTEERKLFLGGT